MDADFTSASAPLVPSHGADDASAVSATLPPALTPATTTRQAVALGFLSPSWGSDIVPTTLPFEASSTDIANAPATFDDANLPIDLTASIGSVPSATTTLTNTIPSTQSAALRALNAPAFQSRASPDSRSQAAKSTSSRTTLSSQPVVVRTYSGARNKSMVSGRSSPRFAGRRPPAQQQSALSAGLMGRADKLPSADDFTFSAILRAVDPEIREAIDAIAEICAKSRMSLADEYDAHLPPQGEITGTGRGWVAGVGAMPGRGRISRISQGWTTADTTLMAVPEASSSSERLAGGSIAGSSKKRSRSAYGSLKSVISGSSNGKRRAAEDPADAGRTISSSPRSAQGPAWVVDASSPSHPAISILASPRASKHLSLDTSSTIRDTLEDEGTVELPAQRQRQASLQAHRRNRSSASLPAAHARSTSLASLTSWLPWPRASGAAPAQMDTTGAESRLREVLLLAQELSAAKGKAAVGAA